MLDGSFIDREESNWQAFTHLIHILVELRPRDNVVGLDLHSEQARLNRIDFSGRFVVLFEIVNDCHTDIPYEDFSYELEERIFFSERNLSILVSEEACWRELFAEVNSTLDALAFEMLIQSLK